MPSSQVWAGALSLVLRHHLTGCPLTARQAAALLEHIASHPGLDDETRALCEQAGFRLAAPGREGAACSHRP